MRVAVCSFLALSCLGANVVATRTPSVLAFEARAGEYVARGAGYSLTVTSGGAVLRLHGRAVRMSVVGAKAKSSLDGLDRMPGKANYLFGRDVRASYDLYGRVRQRGIYDGIDIVYRADQELLEYDFEIAARRDARRISLAFEGIDRMRIDADGDLVLVAGDIEIHQPRPIAYQILAGKRQTVDVAYRIDASNHVRFPTGAYDHERPLVIDPQIVFDKSFGGSALTSAAGLARDAQGNLYVTGITNSPDFGTVNPFQNRLGSAPLAVTANAGQNWTFPSIGTAMAVNALVAAPSAPLIIYAAAQTGVVKSTDGGNSFTATSSTGLQGPVQFLAVDASIASTVYAAAGEGFFVSTDGAQTWQPSTKGLTGNLPMSLAADPSTSGTVYASIVGPHAFFRSTDFGQTWTQIPLSSFGVPASPRAIAFGPNGTMVVGTDTDFFFSADGGNTWQLGSTQVVFNNQTLAFSPSGTLYMINPAGVQQSTDNGQTFSVLFASPKFTQQARITIDPNNPATLYVEDTNLLYRSTDGGQTWSQLPVPFFLPSQALFVSPADSRLFVGTAIQNTGFVTKWSADGSQVLYSTYFGGSGSDRPSAIAVDASGSAYITGNTYSPDFPTTSGAFQTKFSNAPETFVSKLSPDGSKLNFSTLIGNGSVFNSATSIAVDSLGEAVIAGTTAGNYPVTNTAKPSVLSQGCGIGPPFVANGDAFVTKITANGSALVYSTLLGGSCATYGYGLALDATGNAWLVGTTVSPDLQVTSDALQLKFGGGVFDGYLAHVNSSGSVDYLSYIGGTGYDAINAIALDQSGNIFVTGESGGLPQSASAGAYQAQANASCRYFNPGPGVFEPEGNALVLKLDPKAHAVQRLTYLGAPGCLAGATIAVDSSDEPWISGLTNQPTLTFPTANPVQVGGQGFISKFSADFTQLVFSTYFDSISGLVLDSSGMPLVAGSTNFDSVTATQSAFIAKIDPAPAPTISLNSVQSVVPSVNPSNFQGIAPGEVIQLVGQNIGPVTAASGVVQSGVLATTVAGVQVTFDGVAVPLLSVSAQQIELVAPFELANKSKTVIQVRYNNAQSNALQVLVSGAALQVLGVFNDDFSANSQSNPAKAGSGMTLYLAGVGQTNPPSVDGQINAAPPSPLPFPISLDWFGLGNPNNFTLTVTFAGAAPGLAAGIFQVNFIAPPQTLMNVDLEVQDSVSGQGVRYALLDIFAQ